MFLVWLMAVPLAGAIATLIAPKEVSKAIAAITSLVGLVGYAGLLFISRAGIDWAWIPQWGIRFHLVSDGLSLFLLGLSAVLFVDDGQRHDADQHEETAHQVHDKPLHGRFLAALARPTR